MDTKSRERAHWLQDVQRVEETCHRVRDAQEDQRESKGWFGALERRKFVQRIRSLVTAIENNWALSTALMLAFFVAVSVFGVGSR